MALHLARLEEEDAACGSHILHRSEPVLGPLHRNDAWDTAFGGISEAHHPRDNLHLSLHKLLQEKVAQSRQILQIADTDPIHFR